MRLYMDILSQTGTITGLFQKEIRLEEPFIDFALRFTRYAHTSCLISGTDLDCARYHMLAARPFLILSGKGKKIQLRTEDKVEHIKADPFDALARVLNHFKTPGVSFPEPVSAGLFGYLAYDLKNHIETLPRTTMDDLDLPGLYMTAPSLIVIQDKQEGKTRVFIPEKSVAGKAHVDDTLKFFNRVRRAPMPADDCYTAGCDLNSSFDKNTYMAQIDKIREYIEAGDVYQVNMSQRFDTAFRGNPACLFKTLYQKNPAPFFALLNAGDHWIVSSSPERFINRSGPFVQTRPIKGTCARKKDAGKDRRHREQLVQSPKDDAELSMIVDLMRNDLSKVSTAGSVCVTEHKRVEAYANVYHLVSIISSTLDPASNSVDLIKAVFPPGSITGCPKIRAMQIIDELEPHCRHIYTGAVGYISFHDTLDLSVAIRTATVRNGRIFFSAGGGVVFDSDPAKEHQETLDKAQSLIQALAGSPAPEPWEPMAWMNGRLIPARDAVLPLSDLGVQYGHGFFETLKVDQGKIRFLDRHVRRLKKAWTNFFPQPFPQLCWDKIIKMVVDACRLFHTTAAVKIMVTRGGRAEAPWDHKVIVTARPYTHRLEAKSKKGLDLVCFEHPRLTPMAAYKSMNYQYYYLAGIQAKVQGADESLILNPGGSISEGNTSNILFMKDNTLVVPFSDYRLPGVMEEQVIKIATARGYDVVERRVFLNQLNEFNQVIACNSLMEAVPVKSIDHRPLNIEPGFCNAVNQALYVVPR